MEGDADLREVADGFQIDGTWLRAAPFGSGHIHRTYLAEFELGGGVIRYVHQIINEEIFRDVPGLMRNVQRVTSHLRARAAVGPAESRWEIPALVPTRDGELWLRDTRGRSWRTFRCIENVHSFDVAPGPEVAREAARAFGRFARELADFDPAVLVESIPGFHDLDGRLARLRSVVREDPAGRARDARAELDAVDAHADIARRLRELRATGRLPVRVAHNDTKVNNALLDDDSGRGVAVIDLDTVMPGTLLFDFGDLVRSATCRAAEDERDLSRVAVDPALFAAVSDGYVSEVRSIATSVELDHLLFGGRFMTLIIGVRFLTDHLEGDRYFRTSRPGQNLDRARVQLALLRSMEESADSLSRIVRDVL